MLKKRKEATKNELPAPNPSPAEKNTAPVSYSREKSNSDKTVIGQHISIEGSIRGKENLLIEGKLKGSIEAAEHEVTVGLKGQVEAEIHAKDVTISGRMVGNIKALDKVKLTKEAEFKGEVQAKRISVEDGAYVKSVIELDRDDSNLDKGDSNKVVSTGKPDFRPPASKTPKKEPDNLPGSADKG